MALLDENGNFTAPLNNWQDPNQWQSANGGMSQTMPVPMTSQPTYGYIGGNPINPYGSGGPIGGSFTPSQFSAAQAAQAGGYGYGGPESGPLTPEQFRAAQQAQGNWWSQNTPGGAQGAPGGLNGPTVDINAIKQYGASRGYNMSDQEAQYWVDKWPELYARGQEIGQPDYAMGRLQLADQWTAPSQRAAAPAGYGGTVGGLGGGMSPTDVMAQDPGYQFRLGEGLNAIQRGAAARGTLLTGGLQKGLQRYAQDYASGEYGNIFNRNMDLARLGQFGATGTAQGYSNAGQAAGIYGQGMAGALQNQGNVQGAGTVGAGNAWSGTLGQLGNLAAIYAMQRGRGY